jgi:hypothetical protein
LIIFSFFCQELSKCQLQLHNQYQELTLQHNIHLEELKEFYEQKLFTQEMNFQQKLTETIHQLNEQSSQHILKLKQEYESNLLIEKSRAMITEQKLKEFYNKRNENLILTTETTQQTFNQKIQRYEILIERYQNDIIEYNKKNDEWNDEKEKYEKKIFKFQKDFKENEIEKLNLEYEVSAGQEVCALIIMLYRNGRVRTTDDYNSEELYGYLMRSSPERRRSQSKSRRSKGERDDEEENIETNGRRGGEEEQRRLQKKDEMKSLNPQEEEMIVSLATLKKVYEMSKVRTRPPPSTFSPLLSLFFQFSANS